jgi:hypothetical protein
VTVDLVGRTDHLNDPLRQQRGVHRLLEGALNDGELVAAHPRDGVHLPHEAAQAIGHRGQELVAAGMSERVVHVLEVIEVEKERCYDFAAPRACHGELQLLLEQDAVGQVGQRVMMRHVRDLGIGASLLGDVLVGGDPTAVGHGLMRDADDAPVGERLDLYGALLFTHRRQAFTDVALGVIAGMNPCGNPIFQYLAECRSGFHLLRRKTIHQRIAVVGDDQALLGVEHAQALVHIR